MSLLGTGSVHLTGRYGNRRVNANTKYASGNQVCQKCLQRGHWTYECKNEAVYKPRPSRTQQLKNPKARQRFLSAEELPAEFLGPKNASKVTRDAKKSSKRKRSPSASTTSGSSSSSSDDSDSSGTSSGTSSSGDSSTSSDSSSGTSSSSDSGSSSGSESSSSDSDSGSEDDSPARFKKTGSKRHKPGPGTSSKRAVKPQASNEATRFPGRKGDMAPVKAPSAEQDAGQQVHNQDHENRAASRSQPDLDYGQRYRSRSRQDPSAPEFGHSKPARHENDFDRWAMDGDAVNHSEPHGSRYRPRSPDLERARSEQGEHASHREWRAAPQNERASHFKRDGQDLHDRKPAEPRSRHSPAATPDKERHNSNDRTAGSAGRRNSDQDNTGSADGRRRRQSGSRHRHRSSSNSSSSSSSSDDDSDSGTGSGNSGSSSESE